MQPISASDEPATVVAAASSATNKALSALSPPLGKQTTRKGIETALLPMRSMVPD
jgi:hypothetical protein